MVGLDSFWPGAGSRTGSAGADPRSRKPLPMVDHLISYGAPGPRGRALMRRRRLRLAAWCLFLALTILPFLYRMLSR